MTTLLHKAVALPGVLLLVSALPVGAQQKAPARTPPARRAEQVQVGNPVIGKQLFQKKGCVNCHAIKGEGGQIGPDLGRIQHTHNIYQMASIMWNHSTQMREAMEAKGIKRPEFKGDEFAHILAYLHSLEVVGDPEKGKVVFERKGCARCHAINGEGGKIGPELARTTHPHPPIELAGMMWNHSPTMTAMMGALGIPRPVFEGNEMADLLAYLGAVQRQSARGAGHPMQHHGH
jgi:cytochrome c2